MRTYCAHFLRLQTAGNGATYVCNQHLQSTCEIPILQKGLNKKVPNIETTCLFDRGSIAHQRKGQTMQRLWTIGILLLVTRTPALAQTEQFLKELLGTGTKPESGAHAPSGATVASGLSTMQISSGLKKALKIGTQHAVQSIG